MVAHTLTGNRRFRSEKRLLRAPLVILQVQVHAKGEDLDHCGGSHGVNHCYWRDATVEDITVEGSK